MDGAQLAAGPYGGGQLGGDADEPAVGVVLRGACLAGDGGGVLVEVVLVVEAHAGAALHHALHQFEHHVGCGLAEGFAAVGGEAFEHHALVVLDAGDEDRLDVFALVGEGGHGAGHLGHGDLGCAHADGGDGVDGAADAHLAGYVDHLLRRALFHEVGRDPVDGVGEGPFEGHHLAFAFMARVAGAPVGLAPHLEADLRVGHLGAGVHAEVLEGHGVDEGLEGGAHLAVALHVVVFEEAVVDAAHVGADVSGAGLDGHQARVEELLAVDERVPGTHGGVLGALPGEDAHLDLLVEGFADFLLAEACGLEAAVAVAVLHGLGEEVLLLLGGDVAEGVALAGSELALEGGLYLLAEVFAHGLLGIALHARVDGGVDLQAVLVHVVVVAIGFAVVLAPVFHVGADVLAQIGCQAVVVALGRVARHVDGFLLVDGQAVVAEVAVVVHLGEDDIAALQRVVGVQHGAVGRGGFEQSHEYGGLVDVQLGGRLVEEGLRGGLDAEGIAAEVDGVEVHGENLLLGVVVLQLDGHDPLTELGEDGATAGVGLAHLVEVLGQLLGDGGAAAGGAMASDDSLEEHAEETACVDAGVAVETGVLGGDEGIDEVGGKLVVGDVGAVLEAYVAQHLAVVADDLGGLQAVGILDVLELRHVANPSDGQEEEEEEHEGPEAPEGPPHVLDVFRAFTLSGCTFIHNAHSCCCIRCAGRCGRGPRWRCRAYRW